MFFTGNTLNRLSHLRSNASFLNYAITHPSTQFLLFSHLKPLFTANATKLRFLNCEQVQKIALLDKLEHKIFLGVWERKEENANDANDGLVWKSDAEGDKDQVIRGRAYWAIEVQDALVDSPDFKFLDTRPHVFNLSPFEASLVAEARAVLDWNLRHPFCPNCGRKTASREGGWKRTCLTGNIQHDNVCLSAKTNVQNFQYPRTDPVIITLVSHPTKNLILLGRQKSWPSKLHSCVAGFVEAGESIEEAVQREVYEETGLEVENIRYVSSQPWPFPNSLMLGFIATAKGDLKIDLRDQELESAKWFSLDTVSDALERAVTIDPRSLSNEDPMLVNDDIPLFLPPPFAIAHQLMKKWVEDHSVNPK